MQETVFWVHSTWIVRQNNVCNDFLLTTQQYRWYGTPFRRLQKRWRLQRASWRSSHFAKNKNSIYRFKYIELWIDYNCHSHKNEFRNVFLLHYSPSIYIICYDIYYIILRHDKCIILFTHHSKLLVV